MLNSNHFIHIQTYQSPVGEIVLGSYDNKLCLVNWSNKKKSDRTNNRLKKGLDAVFVEESSEIINEAIKQLDEYFKGERQYFDIPLLMVGTEFQKSVWNALLQIPFGKTASYAEQAKRIGNEKAVRAVANANAANAISILIPCHRIIGSDGTLTGYAGGLDVKKKLLELEKKYGKMPKMIV